MKNRTKKIIIILLVIGTILMITLLACCVVKKERWTWDEHGPGKDEWYEPGIPDDETPGFEMLLLVMAIIGCVLIKIKRNEKS